ncbi:hypothetical protein [Adhaeretor mobilis]|uniref:Uncharacterized protein n=1 Tax=Adhaeretor mobilis TaxID=1930276 RepID=A0A517N0T4_9BACT|nr:hypothetical protein [Adhaeretor mobilis]QDT00745.1 hypothetical protein HG15A2_40850 [Adhaeretor mobilis]
MNTQSIGNRVITFQNGLKLLAWTTMLLASLAVTQISGDWGHSVCGPWGCGPPTQALVGCHLAWFVVLLPLVFLSSNSSRLAVQSPIQLGMILLGAGTLMLLTLLIYQGVVWWPEASEWQRNFFWQRFGFSIATSVDIPALQLLTVGFVMIGVARASSAPPQEDTVLTTGERLSGHRLEH